MKKSILLLLPIVILLFFVFLVTGPAPLLAQTENLDYIPLAPLPGQDISGGVSLDKYLPYMFTLLIGVSALLAIVMIVAGGIKYMTTDIFSSKSNAKETIQNAIYGLLLVIASYMILYTVNPDLLSFRIQFPQLNNPGWGLIGLPSAPGGGGGGGLGAGGWLQTSQCPNANCNPEALQAAGFDVTAANVMSCIAMTENSGRAEGCNGNACGTFQIMLTQNQLVGPACGGTLNCPALCRGARGVAVRSEESCQPCVRAAQNPECNAQAAANLYRRSGYAPWTSLSDNQKSAACISRYGNPSDYIPSNLIPQ